MSEMKTITLNGKKYDGFVDPVARELATAFAVINSASGESITMSDASDSNLRGLSIYGKTTQNGTPTPDAPVDFVSVGDSGNITVEVTGKNQSQSMAVVTPNGLPGIPVDSGGNYTDANGQQWICDEIDLDRGVYVKRVDIREVTENSQFTVTAYGDAGYYRITITNVDTTKVIRVPSMCSHFVANYEWEQNKEYYYVAGDVTSKIYLFSNRWTSKTEFAAWLKEQADNGTPLTFVYERGTVIETTLTEEELAAYKALYTYREHTTVSNDAGAYMELEYVMDAKKYIDSLVVAGGASARLSNVTLLASKWTGSDSLYSQVVTINGITPYSKVDLLPSVEQLAIFHNKDVAFVTENEDGVVTVFAIGDKPTQDYTMQVSITEVVV
jgi:hypothetical protein